MIFGKVQIGSQENLVSGDCILCIGLYKYNINRLLSLKLD